MPAPAFDAQQRTVVELDADLIRLLRPEARRRDVTVGRLVLDLLLAIATDGLATAVLDDAPRKQR